MRKLSLLALLATPALPSIALAAPPPCADAAATDCLRDDVLFISGAGVINCKAPNDCTVDSGAAVTKALTLIGMVPDTQWDQFVVFGHQSAPASNPPAPLFFREGYSTLPDGTVDKWGVNEVPNIGLQMGPRVAGRPFVGWIAAGGTQQAGANPVSGQLDACGRNATSDQPNPGLCYSGLYNYFDALAQATGSMFGPYLAGPKDIIGADPAMMKPGEFGYPLSVAPATKSGLVKVGTASAFGPRDAKEYASSPANAAYFGVRPRIWNSLLDTGGSIMGGSAFRDNGNGTFETTKPTPFWGINVPFAAGWKAGTVLSGSQILRFQPLDLYAMGFIDATELPVSFRSFMQVAPGAIYKPALSTPDKFDKVAGPMMGLRTGVAVRPIGLKADDLLLKSMDILTANGGPRPAAAKRVIKQLWIVATKSAEQIEASAMLAADAKTEEEDKEKEAKKVRDDAAKALDNVTIWRHQFPAYFYMLTNYKGRVTTTYDGVDDNAYWEFNQKADDEKMFKAEGATIVLNGAEPIPNSSEIKTVLRFQNSGGGDSGVRYDGSAFPIRIPGSQDLKAPYNAVAVRMRVPGFVPKGSWATIRFNNGPEIRIPSSCGTPARANCKESAFLVNDGKWRTYSATLNDNEDFKGGTFDGFFFEPTNQGFDNDNPDDGIEVEFIRVANVPSPKDSDLGCTACSKCGGLTDAAAKSACTKACNGKEGTEKVSVALADGWIDSEDNCPNHYNPLQEDGNDDGVGDACEDFDGDGVVNSCDNCPTTTNSRQRDQNANDVGDVCDGEQPTPCFLAPDSLAGPIGTPPGVFLGVMFGGVVGLLAYRRRRRR